MKIQLRKFNIYTVINNHQNLPLITKKIVKNDVRRYNIFYIFIYFILLNFKICRVYLLITINCTVYFTTDSNHIILFYKIIKQ